MLYICWILWVLKANGCNGTRLSANQSSCHRLPVFTGCNACGAYNFEFAGQRLSRLDFKGSPKVVNFDEVLYKVGMMRIICLILYSM